MTSFEYSLIRRRSSLASTIRTYTLYHFCRRFLLLPFRPMHRSYFRFSQNCKDSYSYRFYYVIGLVTLNRPGVQCLPYVLHLSSYFPRLSIVLPHNYPSSLNRKGFERLVRPYDKHEKIRPRKSYKNPSSVYITIFYDRSLHVSS